MATFTNQATLLYNNSTAISNVVTGEIVDPLTITKTAVEDTYTQGDKVTYVVNITNSSATDYTGVTFTDNLGVYPIGTGSAAPLNYEENSLKYFINGVLQTPAPTPVAANPLTISGISIPANGIVTIVYSANVTEYAPLDTSGEINNTAGISGGGIVGTLSDSETIDAALEPRLSIVKSVNPSTVVGTGPITYTFTIQNFGNTEATADDLVQIIDTFNPVLSINSVTYNGIAWTLNTNYQYNTTTGLFETVAGQITVPAATYTQDATTGEITITPGTSTVTVTGTV